MPLRESPGGTYDRAIVVKPSPGFVLDSAFKSLQHCGLAEEASKHAFPLEADLSFLRVLLEVWELSIVDPWTEPDPTRREVESCTFRVGTEIKSDLFFELGKHFAVIRLVSFCDGFGSLCEYTTMLVGSLVAIENECSRQPLKVVNWAVG
jgi:hypothetical protein